MRTIVGFLIAFNCITVFADDEQSYYGDRSRGWYWYEKNVQPEEVKGPEKAEPEATVIAESTTEKPLTPRERLKKQGEEWEDSLALAILEPSQANYIAYAAKTKQINEQSEKFATGYKETIWVTPEYDYTLEKPRDTAAIIGQNQQNNAAEDQALATLAKDNGILFYFRSDCPHCHRFAPVLKLFAEQYGFTIIPVSLDGEGLPEFPYPKKDHDLSEKLNIQTVPAVFLVNPENSQVATVGYGFNDWLKLKAKTLYAGQQMIAASTGENQ